MHACTSVQRQQCMQQSQQMCTGVCRLPSSTSIRYYQRNLAAIRRRANFKVKAVLCLREHALPASVFGARSIYMPRIKPIKHSEKCCECRHDLNPYQGKNCVRKEQGIEAYDRGALVSDFARLPDSQYETDQEDAMQHDPRYDSDCSYDFEDELDYLPRSVSPERHSDASNGADAELAALATAAAAVPMPFAHLPDVPAPSTSETAAESDAGAIDLAGDTSDSDDCSRNPPPVISSALQRYITETFRQSVAELRVLERSTLQKNFAKELEKLKVSCCNCCTSCVLHVLESTCIELVF